MHWKTDEDRSYLPVELTVNGRAVAARPGQTILELVREQHLDTIPTLCHEPGLPPFGSCFLCVIEVKDARGLLPSCTTRVRDGMEVVTRSDRITRARKTALALLLSDHYADCACPGQLACPAGVDVQGYLGLARLGHYREALRLIRERNPLPVVCGRVCVRKCEAACRRNLVDESVGINHVKRFVSGHASVHPDRLPPTGKRVAVVGGGPAGLTCAYYLSLRGHSVAIHEAMPRLGGMLRYGIPAYRLPREELDADIDVILSLGVEIVGNRKLGRDFTLLGLREEGFHAIFLAPGAPLGKKLGIPGEDASGVESALDFLRDTELHGPRDLHGRVVVVGGGNSAVDAARTAVRCGAEEVEILYRRSRREMPAFHEEVDAAEQEGVRLTTLVAPGSVIRDAVTGRLTGIRCVRMELGEPDRSGRRRPLPVEGSEFEVPCSFVFPALGQETDPDLFSRQPEGGRPAVGPPGTIEADATTMACRLP
ncbi:MAG: FAD-dependent oxidoreductase, partial [Candidatus Deferrimicrobiaceae bacterium]